MSKIVTLTYDPVWTPLTWAKENCPSYITNDLHQDGYNTYDRTKIDYFFADTEDAFKFALRFGNERI